MPSRTIFGFEEMPLAAKTVQVSIRGTWKEVPGFDVNGKTIVVLGNWVRVARVHQEDWLETELGDPEPCVRELKEQRKQGLRVDVLTFAQKLPDTARRYEYPLDSESVAAIGISSFKEWWEGLPQETRKNVRRSQKRGVEIKLGQFGDEIVKAIAAVNNETPVRQGRRFPHYGKTLDQVKKDYSSYLDRSDLICAYYGTELIGFLKVVYRGDIASVLQLLVKSAHHDKRPANALLAKAVELCTARGLSHLTYGKFNYGNKGDSSLTEFKTRHGFQEVLVPRYYVPLTGLGTLYTKLGLYRGFLGILPGGFITAGLKARLAWYNVKCLSGRCSSTVEQPSCNRPMERSSPPAGSNPNAQPAPRQP